MTLRWPIATAIAIVLVVAAIPGHGEQQPGAKRLTIVCSVCGEDFMVAERERLVERLRKTGRPVGRNVEVVYKSLGVERVPTEEQVVRLLSEAVKTRPDVLIAMDLYTAIAARREVREIPTLFSVFDPVGLGIVDSLARPGGNMTGFANSVENLDIKRLQLLQEMVPSARRIGVLTQGDFAPLAMQYSRLKEAAGTMKLELREYSAGPGKSVADDAVRLFAEMARDRVEAFLLGDGNTFSQEVLSLAAKHRLPTIYPYGNTTRRGGLASYQAIGRMEMDRYIVLLLEGKKPAELPVQTPAEYRFIVNMKAAREAGLKIPETTLRRATEIIE